LSRIWDIHYRIELYRLASTCDNSVILAFPSSRKGNLYSVQFVSESLYFHPKMKACRSPGELLATVLRSCGENWFPCWRHINLRTLLGKKRRPNLDSCLQNSVIFCREKNVGVRLCICIALDEPLWFFTSFH